MYTVLIIILSLLLVALVMGAFIKFSKLRNNSDDWKKIVEE